MKLVYVAVTPSSPSAKDMGPIERELDPELAALRDRLATIKFPFSFRLKSPEEHVADAMRDNSGPVCIYFFESKLTKLVKIGFTKNLKARHAQVARQTGGPIQCLLSFRAEQAIESQLHWMFHRHRVHGEWFRREGELASFIKSNHRVRAE